MEIETDKATTDIPSPFAGKVSEIKVSQGDEVKVNQVIMIIETDQEEENDDKEDKKEEDEKEKTDSGKKDKKVEEKEDDESGEEKKTDKKEDNKDKKEEKEGKKKTSSDSSELKETTGKKEKDKEDGDKENSKRRMNEIPAPPSVRRLARELDVDLTEVEGSGPGNRISYDDVKRASKGGSVKEKSAAAETKIPDFEKWGSISEEPMTRIRQITARNVTDSWQTIPHVTQFDEADITNLENFRKQHLEKVEKNGGKLTITALLLKIGLLALQKIPQI